MKITKYSVKINKIKVFSCTIVRFQFKITGISHISHNTYISYCFSTSCAYLTTMSIKQIIAPIQATVRKSHTVLNTHIYYLLQYIIDTGVLI